MPSALASPSPFGPRGNPPASNAPNTFGGIPASREPDRLSADLTQPVPAPRPQPLAEEAPDPPGGPVLVLDTGQELAVRGGGLLGRDPRPPEDGAHTHVMALDDPDRSISKTHLEFGVEAGELWVEDLGSTNGTRVFSAEGGVTELAPGRRLAVRPGETVQFGDRYFTVKDS